MPVKYTRMKDGSLAAWVWERADDEIFNMAADRIVDDFGGNVVNKLDGLDQRYWDIEVEQEKITLHLETFMGIGILSNRPEDEPLVKKIAAALGVLEVEGGN